MMQPTLPPSPKAAASIFDAIKDGDWEGLATLYATAAYDAVHAAEFARRGGADFRRQQSSPPSLRAAAAGGPGNGVFRDEKKLESGAQRPSTSSPVIRELDLVVREIIGAGIFDGHRSDVAPASHQKQPSTKPQGHANKRKSPPGLSTLDNLLFHSHPAPLAHRRTKTSDAIFEKVMWDSAAILSNGRPSPSFAAHRSDRTRREEASVMGKTEEGNGEEEKSAGDDPSIFEGNVANATPGDLIEGGTGSGTAQHLACLLDSPFALAVLIALGVNVEARHTAFRRLAVHEAACSDSPLCLGLLMEVGTRCSMELFPEVVPPTAAPVAATSATAAGDVLKSSSAPAKMAPLTYAAAAATGFDSFGALSEAISDETGGSINEPGVGSKPGKKKFLFGWQKGKAPRGRGSSLKKSISSSAEGSAKRPGFTSFPAALRVVWEAAKLLQISAMSEMDAAHYILDRIKISNRARMILAMQCPRLPLVMKQSQDKAAAPPLPSSPFASITGLFQPNHRDVQTLFIKRNVDGHGNTPLHWSAFKNSVRAMDVLLSYDVDVNSRAQPSGWTPLHDAAYSNAGDTVARLIMAGATVDARSHSGATPLCFAAQEDAPNATRMLLQAGADPSMRCLGNSPGIHVRANNADNNQFHSRFSGYTPLHYCAHYNAAKAARVLLYENYPQNRLSATELLEIPDLNEKLPLHVAVARGSSLVLREFLHAGARVHTSSYHPPPSPRLRALSADLAVPSPSVTAPVAVPQQNNAEPNEDANAASSLSTSPGVITPVSSPVLKAMIPSQPIASAKPWNCLSQKSIDACKHLIQEVEMNWTPQRHTIFSPADRVAVVEVLRVGKRLEQVGRGIFLDLWPHVLSYCGRGWFEPEEEEEEEEEDLDVKPPARELGREDNEEEISMQSSSSSGESSREEEDFTQFQLEGSNGGMAHAIL
ncbi:hypothetical protein ACHAXT_000807 [Thalassiosira profunda]